MPKGNTLSFYNTNSMKKLSIYSRQKTIPPKDSISVGSWSFHEHRTVADGFNASYDLENYRGKKLSIQFFFDSACKLKRNDFDVLKKIKLILITKSFVEV